MPETKLTVSGRTKLTVSGGSCVSDETPRGTQPGRRAAVLLRLVLHLAPLAALVVAAVWLGKIASYPVSRVEEALRYPYQLDAEEGYVLWQAVRLASGERLYKTIHTPPYLVENYPPLYPALWALFVRPDAPSLAAGRWISALSALAVALGVGAFILLRDVREGTVSPGSGGAAVQGTEAAAPREGEAPPADTDRGNRLEFYAFSALRISQALVIGWCCPILFLTSYEMLRWVAYTRVDFLSIALTVGGLTVFGLWGQREKSRWGRAAAIVLFALALLAKQTVLAAPAACFLWLLIRERRGALWFALWMGLAALLPVGLLTALTGGQYWLHTVTYNQNVMHWNELWQWWLPHLWRLYHFPIAGAAVLCVWVLFAAWKRGTSRALELVAIYFVLNALSTASVAKSGSAENYLLEPQVALALFLGIGLKHALESMQRRIQFASWPVRQLACSPVGQSDESDRSDPSDPSDRSAPSAPSDQSDPSDRSDLSDPSASRTVRQSALSLPQHSALSPQHSALSPQHSVLSPQHSVLSPQHSVLSPQSSALTVRWMGAVAAAAVLTMLMGHADFFQRVEPALFAGAPRPSFIALQRGHQVRRLVREHPGPVLSEDPIYGILEGRQPELQNFIMTQLAAEKKWDESEFVRRAASREFSLAVTHQDIRDENQVFDRCSPALRHALRENYSLIRTLPRPRPLQTIFVYAPIPQAPR